VKDLILSRQASIQAALPKHMDVERFSRIVLVTMSQNPKLLDCTPMSLLTAVMQAAQLGLEPGVLGQCYLIPYWNDKKKANEVQFQIGYKGLIELCRRSGVITSIAAHEVREHDHFEYEFGFEEKLIHRPSIKDDRGKVYAYYAYAVLKDGGRAVEVMSKAEIEKYRDHYSQAFQKNSGPWRTEFDEMAKKTVVKKLIKYLPASAELLRSMMKAETAGKAFGAGQADMMEFDMDIMGDWGEPGGEGESGKEGTA